MDKMDEALITSQRLAESIVTWAVGDPVICVMHGDPTVGKILDAGDGKDVLVKFPGRKARWMDTEELVHYEDLSGETNGLE